MAWLAAAAVAQPLGCAPSAGPNPGAGALRVSGEAPDSRPIACLGRIEPKGGILTIGGTPGMRVGTMEVEEGQVVKKGGTLFKLDSYPTLAASLQVAEAQLQEAKALLVLETSNQELLERELALKARQVDELDPLDLQAQQERVNLLERAYAQARNDHSRFERLRAANSSAVSLQDLEAARLQADKSESELKAARLLLKKAELGLQLSKDRLDYERLELKLATQKAELAARVASARAQHAAAQSQLEAAVVRAPAEGQVLRILTHQGESIGNQPVLQLGNTDEMVAVAEVSELDILRLRQATGAGPVRAQIAALKDQVKLTGSITAASIRRVFGKNNLLSLNPMYNSDQRVVEVEIELDKGSAARARQQGLSNLQVDVTIDLRPAPAAAAAERAARSVSARDGHRAEVAEVSP